MFRRHCNNRASILILSLWILMLLTVFATTIGLKVRQRMLLLSRLEERSRLHYISEAAIKLALAALRADITISPTGRSVESKITRYNNPELFEKIEFDEGYSFVGFSAKNGKDSNTYHYGLIDEERKININTADRTTLKRLIEILTNKSESDIALIVESIIDWREVGGSQLVGFSSNEYYTNLPHPYLIKNAPLEMADELLLVQGFDEQFYETIKPFITIYGDGLVNINTASLEVLIALGLDEPVAQKLIFARVGIDGVESTFDDHIFINSFDVTRDVQSKIALEKEEAVQVDFLNAQGKIKTDSFYYLIRAEGRLDSSEDRLRIACVYNAKDNIIEYWREKN